MKGNFLCGIAIAGVGIATGYLLNRESEDVATELGTKEFNEEFNREMDLFSGSLSQEGCVYLENAIAVLISFQEQLPKRAGDIFARYLLSAIVARNVRCGLSNKIDKDPKIIEDILHDAVSSLTIIARSCKDLVTLSTVLGALHTVFRSLEPEVKAA